MPFKSKLIVALTLAMLAGPVPAIAQTYPTKPVRVLVTFAAGGAIDIIGRIMAQALAASLGQAFVVENRPGVGGLLALEAVANAPPDGYTLAIGSGGPLTISPTLFKERGFDPIKQLDPIILFSNTKIVLVAKNDLKASNPKELVALPELKSGNITMASGGNGSITHLIGEYFQTNTGVKWTHVPYKGSALAYGDLVAGRVDLMFDTQASALPYLKTGQIKAIAITSAKRSGQLPGVPTFEELGFAGFADIGSWSSLMAPKGTPPGVIDRLNNELNRALMAPEMLGRLASMELEPEGGSPERVTKYVASELARWTTIIQTSGAKAN